MAIRATLFVMIGLVGIAAAQPGTPAPAPITTIAPPRDDVLREVVGLMSGAFSSEAQSKSDPNYFDIRLHMTRIWPQEKDGAWLYVEQAVATALEKPYRQRVYHVTVVTGGTVKSEVYQLPGDPLDFAGAWREPDKFAKLTPQDLKIKDGCAVVLNRIEAKVYEGGTQGQGCPSERQGAAYATSTVHMDETGLSTWDRGFDKDDQQVWGATKGGYKFDRVKEQPPTSPKPAEAPAGQPADKADGKEKPGAK
ncbi:MAG: chromophore lyase CpcT/CpeT [Planctomycetes bacterium]|nr:chromophore lyase CpcT/CpeT [Planctomycetota bacterium]